MDVTSNSSAVLPDTAVSMNVLVSDVDGNKIVDRTDAMIVKGRNRMAVNASNFRDDVRVSGTIDNTDFKAAKADIGHNLP